MLFGIVLLYSNYPDNNWSALISWMLHVVQSIIVLLFLTRKSPQKLVVNILFLGCCFIICRWGQIFILDSLAQYTPKDDREAQRYCTLYLIRKHSARVDLLRASLLDRPWLDRSIEVANTKGDVVGLVPKCLSMTGLLHGVWLLLHQWCATFSFVTFSFDIVSVNESHPGYLTPMLPLFSQL